MRSLALLLPIGVLVLLLLLVREEPVALVDVAPPEEVVQVEPEREPGIVWISHDWVEVAPGAHRRAAEKAKARRETFGLDLVNEDAQCLDSNCRACLIDFMYGREF